MTLLVRMLEAGLKLDRGYVQGALEVYEAELFQDMYVPEYQQKMRLDLRRKRDEAKQREIERLAAIRKVEAMTEAPPQNPVRGIANKP